jgi:hypothetical protein
VSTNLEKQLAAAGKTLGSAIDQLDLDKRLSAVEKRLGGVAGKVGMAEQRTMLGIPVSRKRPDWGRIATVGAVAVGAVAAGVRFLSGNGDSADDESATAQRRGRFGVRQLGERAAAHGEGLEAGGRGRLIPAEHARTPPWRGPRVFGCSPFRFAGVAEAQRTAVSSTRPARGTPPGSPRSCAPPGRTPHRRSPDAGSDRPSPRRPPRVGKASLRCHSACCTAYVTDVPSSRSTVTWSPGSSSASRKKTPGPSYESTCPTIDRWATLTLVRSPRSTTR